MATTSPSSRVPAARSFPTIAVSMLVTVVVLLIGNLFSSGAARTWWNVVTLGVVEGVTEFLPISSTAHLLIAAQLLHFQGSIGGTFEIFIQLGAILAVVVYFARDLLSQARAIPSSAETRRFWLAILIAFIPAAVVGLLLRNWIKQVLFASPIVIATTLIIGGIVLIVIERLSLRVTTDTAEKTTFKQAFAIGCAQVLALVPGTSRSAASIVGGMFAGLDRAAATKFSFYLVIPTLGAATVVDLLGSIKYLTPGDGPRLLVGTVIAMITAFLSIGWLLRFVAHHKWTSFGIYRILAGAAILLLVAMRVL